MSSEEIPTAGSALVDGTDAAETGAEGSEGMSITDGLMSTDPAINASEWATDNGTSMSVSHGYVGVRKFIHGLTGYGAGSGMPAIGNFVLAAYHALDEESIPLEGGEPDDGEETDGDEEELHGETFRPGEDFG
jgi:hypothetical protein